MGQTDIQRMPTITRRATRCIGHSYVLAQEMGHKAVGTEHVLLALAEDRHSVAAKILQGLEINADQIRAGLEEITKEAVR